MFKSVPSNVDLPKLETEISEYWDKINAFKISMDNRKNNKVFRFYDGPPFPTGSPHYGNLLAGVIKDIVPRYWTMRGIQKTDYESTRYQVQRYGTGLRIVKPTQVCRNFTSR